jgi:hypothetical protein
MDKYEDWTIDELWSAYRRAVDNGWLKMANNFALLIRERTEINESI